MQYLNGWTKEKVRAHLEANFQGKSEDTETETPSLMCRYRLADKKCVVGCFIPDDKYHSSMEGVSASDVICTNKLSKLMPFSPEDMNHWQTAHDGLDATKPVHEQINELMNYLD